MMVKRLLLGSGFWQQRNTTCPTFISHSSANGGMWVKVLDKNHFLVKTSAGKHECDYQTLLHILKRRDVGRDLFSAASSFFLKGKADFNQLHF